MDDPKLDELEKLLAEGGPDDFKRLAELLRQGGAGPTNPAKATKATVDRPEKG